MGPNRHVVVHPKIGTDFAGENIRILPVLNPESRTDHWAIYMKFSCSPEFINHVVSEVGNRAGAVIKEAPKLGIGHKQRVKR